MLETMKGSITGYAYYWLSFPTSKPQLSVRALLILDILVSTEHLPLELLRILVPQLSCFAVQW